MISPSIVISPNIDKYAIDPYPKALKLIANEPTPSKISKFLDLNLLLEKPDKLITSIYDKRKDFNFKFNKFPNFTSCLSKNIYRNTIINELSRINKLCSNHLTHNYINELITVCNNNSFPINYTESIIRRYNFN